MTGHTVRPNDKRATHIQGHKEYIWAYKETCHAFHCTVQYIFFRISSSFITVNFVTKTVSNALT